MRFLPLCLLLLFIGSIAVMGVRSESPRGGSMASAHGPIVTRSTRDDAGQVSVTLRRAADSHFYADAKINGVTTRVLVDSGASLVALRRRDAEAMGIDVDGLRIAGEARTAGGVVPMRVLTLNEVDIGGIKERNVQAAIVDLSDQDDMPASLLGQSFLARLSSVEIKGDALIMR
ncbi:MAG TPA: TIGR02281 family clan AA aspartic protease [Sphingopyxis sp.]|nr:TIGR02281 family clan AA aspartic protease [Sphingopyxis sp.]